jgi:hypothetical protein
MKFYRNQHGAVPSVTALASPQAFVVVRERKEATLRYMPRHPAACFDNVMTK